MKHKMFSHIFAVIFPLFLFLNACGGGGSGSSGPSQAAMDALSAAYESIGALYEDPAVVPCLSGAATSCNCPGGGTITVSGGTLTFTSCKNVNGETFTGSLTISGSTVAGTLSVFGGCTNAVASDIATSGCSGQITATCAGDSVTGTIAAGDSGCTLDFDGGGGAGGAPQAASRLPSGRQSLL